MLLYVHNISTCAVHMLNALAQVILGPCKTPFPDKRNSIYMRCLFLTMYREFNLHVIIQNCCLNDPCALNSVNSSKLMSTKLNLH